MDLLDVISIQTVYIIYTANLPNWTIERQSSIYMVDIYRHLVQLNNITPIIYLYDRELTIILYNNVKWS